MRASRRFLAFAMASMALCLFASDSLAQPTAPRFDAWITNGPVYDIVHSNGVTYIGGDFTYVTMHTGNGAALNARTAMPQTLPRVNGSLYAVVSDGAGGWYIGGNFTTVDDFVRNRLAHILANGTLNLAWNPDANGRVNTLALHGATLYVGGDFSKIGGQARNFISAIEATTGQVTAWNPNANGAVKALAVNGATIFAGGAFTYVGGFARQRLAALDSTTANATAWNPDVGGTENPEVSALRVNGTTLYVGGDFTSIAGQPRNYLAALEIGSGNPTNWNPSANGPIKTLAVSGGTVYVGGSFTIIGGRTRNNLAALDAANGAGAAWNPNANGSVFCLAVSGSTLFVGGRFTSIGSETRKHIAAIDVATGNALPWNPNAGGGTFPDSSYVYALAASGANVYAGGGFKTIGGLPRNYIAAFNATTGRPTTWNPNANGPVKALAMSGSILYAGGNFTSVGGFPRGRLAALDVATGSATAWNPSVDGVQSEVNAIEVNETTVYVGGSFTTIAGQPRNNIAAVDANTGSITAWNPTANNRVRALAVNGAVVYAGGDFTTIGGQPRNYLAALNAITGSATVWNPQAGGSELPSVQALAVNGAVVYAGGKFTLMSGQTRNRLAAIDATTGSPTPWNPNANGAVRCFNVNGAMVFVGGEFGNIGGANRNHLAALDAATGNATAWNPNATGGNAPYVAVLAVSGANVFVGGNFATISGQPQRYFAHLGETPLNPAPTLVSLSPTLGNRLQTLDAIFNGANFVNDISTVNAGEGIIVNAVTATSATSLTANLTITAAAATGTRHFSVINNGPGGGVSNLLAFVINNPAPTVSSLVPAGGLRGQTLNVQVIGANFISGVSAVSFGPEITVNSVVVESDARLTANITIGASALAGARDVTVVNAFPGGGSATLASAFAINYPVPTLSSITPAVGERLQTLDVVFAGANFINGVTTVNASSGIAINSTTVTSATSLTANLTITAAAATGEHNFSVSNNGPGGGISGGQLFSVNNPVPTLTGIAPAGGGRGQTRNVILTGTNFISGTSTVSFGPEIAVNSVTVNPATDGTTQITANITIPANLANGSRDVTVTNAPPGGGTATIAGGFTVNNPAPTLISVNPIIGSLQQTLNVDLLGNNFISGVSSVNFGAGITTNGMTVVSSTQITARITIGANATLGAHNVSVINAAPGGGTATLNNAFAVSNGTIVQFNLPTDLFGSARDTVQIPLRLDPANRNVGSFDATLNYNPAVLTFVKFTRGTILTSAAWQVDLNSSNGAIGVGAFAANTAIAQAGTALVLHFRVNDTAIPGTVVPLALSNVAATDVNANALPINWLDGVFTVSSEATISGQLIYFANNKTLAGDTVQLSVTNPVMNRIHISDANGRYEFRALPHGSTNILKPRRMAGNYPAGTITAGDALKAFKGRIGGPERLSGYESLAADVTGDCQITSGDALAILKRATGNWTSFRRFGLTDWRYVDAGFSCTPENWCASPQSRSCAPLVGDKLDESFVGIISGDVNGSFGTAPGKIAGAEDGPVVSLSDPVFVGGGAQLNFNLEVSAVDRAYNSFDLTLTFDATSIRVSAVTLGAMLAPQDWQMDWNANQPGVLRIAGFSMSEAAIKNSGMFVVIQAELSTPANESKSFNIEMPLALLGVNGQERQVQTGTFQLMVKTPQQYKLEQNYPNPFSRETPSSKTVIKYTLPETGVVMLRIYDMLGHTVRTLVSGPQAAGAHTVVWNGRKDNGAPAATGVYWYRLEAGAFVKTNKLILQK